MVLGAVTGEVVMSDRHAGRREALSGLWGKIDGFLVSSRANVGYLTGFSGTDAALLLTRDRAIILSDGRYAGQIAAECGGLEARIRRVDQTMADSVAEAPLTNCRNAGR